MRDAGLEIMLATLSGLGLSATELALAEAIAEPGQAYGELAIRVRRRVMAVKKLMDRNGLFARTRARPPRGKKRAVEEKEKEDVCNAKRIIES